MRRMSLTDEVRAYLAKQGAKGGAKGKGKPASKKKAAAARRNARLGGRPTLEEQGKKPTKAALYKRASRERLAKEKRT